MWREQIHTMSVLSKIRLVDNKQKSYRNSSIIINVLIKLPDRAIKVLKHIYFQSTGKQVYDNEPNGRCCQFIYKSE